MKRFKTVPDQVNDLLDTGVINAKDWIVAAWIYTHINPVNGYCSISYDQIAKMFKGIISYDNARKIFSKLRRLRVITFTSHRGAGGKFPVWPTRIKLKGNNLQVIDEQGGVQYATDDNKDTSLYPPIIRPCSQLLAENHNSDIGVTQQTLPDSDLENPNSHNYPDTDVNVNLNGE